VGVIVSDGVLQLQIQLGQVLGWCIVPIEANPVASFQYKMTLSKQDLAPANFQVGAGV